MSDGPFLAGQPPPRRAPGGRSVLFRRLPGQLGKLNAGRESVTRTKAQTLRLLLRRLPVSRGPRRPRARAALVAAGPAGDLALSHGSLPDFHWHSAWQASHCVLFSDSYDFRGVV